MSEMKENVEMMYDANEAVRNLNKIEGFEPKDYLRMDEKENGISYYLDTKYRLLWYRLAYPKGKLMKIPKVLAKDHATFEVRVYTDINDPVDNFLANGFGSCYLDSNNEEFGSKFVECAETIALGRALKDAGFGTQFCDIALPNDTQIVDAGVDIAFDPDNSEMPSPDEDGVPIGVEGSSEGQEEIKDESTTGMPETVAPANTSPTAKSKKEEKKPVQLSADMPMSEIQKHMTLEFAKTVKVSVGFDSGRTLGELAMKKPKSIEFHASRGENNIVKVAAQLLLNEAKKTA